MDADETEGRIRPGPLLWLGYAYGARLPERYSSWVLHDVTTRTWVLRHVVRSLLQFLPFAVILFVVVPVDKTILGIGIAMGALIGLLYSSAFVDNVAESRAMKAGYPEGYAVQVRRRRGEVDRRASTERYEQRWRSHGTPDE
jgi:Family of unknown function (DUF5313)